MSIDSFPIVGAGSYTELSYDDLAVRYQQGDPQALEEVCTRQYRRIEGILIHNGVDSQDVADVAQQVVEKMIGALDKFEPGGFNAWVGRIAHNCAMDYHRRNRHRKSKILNCDGEIADQIVESHNEIEDLNAIWIVDDIIDQLREFDGAGFDSKDLGEILKRLALGEKNIEIAEDMGLNHLTVATRISRLRARLAKASFTRESVDRLIQ
ncbi:RNA polymerase sigma factor Y [Candidatus Saccharibacteria bacterium RAAC3_TM7_1]|nr:RNA polymerase sigma factor Y [Candidatus Saccharibacteria bacterium RAAC3_TM7_1]HCZ28399.1 sigma-70 family RNA polymerase sigma factor [Candidatus Saccharibacteria bacterium]